MAGRAISWQAFSISRCSRWQSTWVRFSGGLVLGMGRSELEVHNQRYSMHSFRSNHGEYARSGWSLGRVRNSILARCCHRGFLELKRKKPPEIEGDLQNVDSALTRFCAGYTQLFLSAFNVLICLHFLVAEVGLEPTAFRL